MVKKSTLFFLTLFFFVSIDLGQTFAAHIIGGDISYACLGGDRYRITMNIYRDCQGSGAAFDSAPNSATTGTVTIYNGNAIFKRTIYLKAPTITRIPAPSNPCLTIPANVCVEQGVYIFEINLPNSPQSYHFVYQRCCRNNSILNIDRPGDVGATFHMEITPVAQDSCNRSPVFKDFPPTVICLNSPLVFDHSATDPDQNSVLRYSFCLPQKGGGKGGLTDSVLAKLPNGVAPDPDTRPPYNGVDFIDPYSAERPLAGDPVISIDPITGLITGVPKIRGQFVVGVCVDEIVDGVIISQTKRDFQFNTTFCERKVDAKIDAALVDDTYDILLCGDNEVTVINASTQEAFIDEYFWKFDIDGQEITAESKDITLSFQNEGEYSGQLILNRNLAFDFCKDTTNVNVRVHGDINADFEFEYDTCSESPVVFRDLSITENPDVISWDWSFGDDSTASIQNPSHQYVRGGNYPISLVIEDMVGCIDTATKNLPYFPIPQILLAAPSRFLGCTPVPIVLETGNEVLTDEYDITWTLSNGEVLEGMSASTILKDPGFYSVDLEVVSPLGCMNDRTFTSWIEVKEGPEAAFLISPETFNELNRTASFQNQSQRGVNYFWDFDGGISQDINPVYTFPDTGIYQVILFVTAANGCVDTAFGIVDVMPLNTFFLPNVFTPNNDDVNDVFGGVGIFTGIRNFSFTIWNRWGEKVFETNNPEMGWDGRHQKSGERASKGVYHCLVTYLTARGESRQVEQAFTLVR